MLVLQLKDDDLSRSAGKLSDHNNRNYKSIIMTRREILRKVMLGTTSLIVLPKVITACSEKEPIDPVDNSETFTIDLTEAAYAPLNVTGGSVIVQGKVIANTGSNIFVAVESVCSHQGGTLVYSHSENVFRCPIHNASFSFRGIVIEPPDVEEPVIRPIKAYTVTRSGDILTIRLNK